MLHSAVKVSRKGKHWKRINRNGGINVALEMHKARRERGTRAVDKCGTTPLSNCHRVKLPSNAARMLFFFLHLEVAFHLFEQHTEPEYVQSSRIRSLARLVYSDL